MLHETYIMESKILVYTLGGGGGGGLRKCTVHTLMKMLTFLDGPLPQCIFLRKCYSPIVLG